MDGQGFNMGVGRVNIVNHLYLQSKPPS